MAVPQRWQSQWPGAALFVGVWPVLLDALAPAGSARDGRFLGLSLLALELFLLVLMVADRLSGLSRPQASQQRYSSGFSRVHMGQAHAVVDGADGRRWACCIVLDAAGFDVLDEVDDDDVELADDDNETGRSLPPERAPFVLDPALLTGPPGFCAEGGTYASPHFSFSSSCRSSMYASMMARSFASSSSAWVRNPLHVASSARALVSLAPEPHPLVIFVRLWAASAMTLRMSAPRRTGMPPSRCPEPVLSTRRCSAAARARRRASCIGIFLPPSLRPVERNPSPVYPLLASSSCSSRSCCHSA